ncbi:ABC transporter ATP-binding protein [Microbacterium sediminis]|uniref:ABC transporter ATP-binding protein n=1 Tax=Microbacterium sediminis TaxID=904291 RepID=A0A1B9NGF0_9MICO|nr:ABC transporter ATP-binding protein [Microbacterium sediminis]OCG75691.1 ABC transporter ATP-binding protein [Microbacterium sediminis]
MVFLHARGITRTVELPDAEPLHILRGVDLDVEVGDHVSIMGRSGSGKSTLLNILGLLDAPTSGTLEFDGVPLDRMTAGRRDRTRGRNVGFVFQQFNLLPRRTALENVEMPLLYDGGRGFWRRRRLAAEMLERVGLGERMAQMPERLSGGEQQRVAIARALVRSPRLILADEPTGALDVETGATIMTLLDQIATQAGAALITITHDPHVAARAQRVFRLSDGVLHAEEPILEPAA